MSLKNTDRSKSFILAYETQLPQNLVFWEPRFFNSLDYAGLKAFKKVAVATRPSNTIVTG